jgi:dihydrolipoamide dehydrogenase
VDSTGALELESIPKKLAVIGGGVIGLEMGSVWARLGTEVSSLRPASLLTPPSLPQVTVIEFLDTITPSLDKEIAKNFQKILTKQGFKFQLGTKVTETSIQDNGTVTLSLEPAKGGEKKTFEADVVLVSTGRRPFTKNIGLEELKIETDRVGRIKVPAIPRFVSASHPPPQVNSHFQTSVPSVYAIGDCIDGPMLAHKAEEEGIACVENLAGFAGHVNYDAIPGVIYTHPEVASVVCTPPPSLPSSPRDPLHPGTHRGANQREGHRVQQRLLSVHGQLPRPHCERLRGLHQSALRQEHRSHSWDSHHRPQRRSAPPSRPFSCSTDDSLSGRQVR